MKNLLLKKSTPINDENSHTLIVLKNTYIAICCYYKFKKKTM